MARRAVLVRAACDGLTCVGPQKLSAAVGQCGSGPATATTYLIALAVATVLWVFDGRRAPSAATIVLPELLGLEKTEDVRISATDGNTTERATYDNIVLMIRT